jgi:LacI family transcriptional regulator
MSTLRDGLSRPTIRDVAIEANVSTSTVSLYMQQDPRVAEGTGERIAAAVRKLGYIHHPRSRAARRTGLFGLLLEELSLTAFPESIYGAILRGIEAEARRQGFGMVVATVEPGQLPQMVRENQVQGVILLGGCPTNDALALELHGLGLPVVLVDNYLNDAALEAIVPDNAWGGYAAFRHLVELGHRRIGIIEGPRKYRTLTDRLWGAQRAAEECGLEPSALHRQPAISSGFPNKGYREMKALLALPEPPTAVFAISDRAALGALDAIREAGLAVPEDISLVGFDDVLYAEHALPPLTTVHYARDQMGSLAMQRLIAAIRGGRGLPVRTTFYTELVVRASTAPPRGGSG